MADPWGTAGEAVCDGAGAISQSTDLIKSLLMDRKTAGSLVDRVSAALAKIPGMPSGRVIQAQILKGLGKVAGVIEGVVQTAMSAAKVTDALKRGDKAAFQKAVTDYIITMTAKVAGTIVGDAVFGGLTAATVGVGVLPATVAGIAAGAGAEALSEWLLNKFARAKLEKLMGDYYDWMKGNNKNGPGTDPGGDHPGFDTPPESSGPGNNAPSDGDNRYQGLKQLNLIN